MAASLRHGDTEIFIHHREQAILATILLLGLLVRLPSVTIDFRATNDLDVYRGWARAIPASGLATIYERSQANYPPGLLYLFGSAASVEAGLARQDDETLTALIKLPSILADILTAGLIAWAIGRTAPARRILACALYVFNPAIWYVSTYWGQTDAVYTLFLVASVIALDRGAIVPAWLAYALALGTKIQSLALAPLLFSITLAQHGVRGLLRGVAVGAATGAILSAPWLVAGRIGEVVQASLTLPNQAPRIVVSGYNLWYLLRLGRVHNVSAALHPAGLPFSYREISIGVYAAFAVLVAGLIWRQPGRSPMAPAALLSMGLFMLFTEVHERYLFPTLAFLLLGAAQSSTAPVASETPRHPIAQGRSLWWAYGVLSVTFLFNLVTVAPFTPALGTNLVAAPVDSMRTLILKGLSVLAAAINTVVLALLVKVTARYDRVI